MSECDHFIINIVVEISFTFCVSLFVRCHALEVVNSIILKVLSEVPV